MSTYSAEELCAWTAADWAKLDGRRVRLMLDASAAVDARLVAHARPGVGPVVVISFDPEGSWTFSPYEAELTVLDPQ